MRHTQPKDINAVERARLAISLRKEGFTLQEIATRCGFADKSGAYRAISRWMANFPEEEVHSLRLLEGARLDDLLQVFMAKARKGDYRAAEIVLRTIEVRAKLFGLAIAPEVREGEPQVEVVVREVPGGWLSLGEPGENGAMPSEAPV